MRACVYVCVWVLLCVCVLALVSARPAPTASASEIARPCIHSRDYSSRYYYHTSLHLDIPALPPIPLSLSDDWFSHETRSHNGINLPRFSLCAFVYGLIVII